MVHAHAYAGYGVEALQYMSSLLQYNLVRPEDLWIRQSGDGRDAKYTDQLPADKKDLLAFQQYDEITKVTQIGQAHIGLA